MTKKKCSVCKEKFEPWKNDYGYLETDLCWNCDADETTQALMDRDRE